MTPVAPRSHEQQQVLCEPRYCPVCLTLIPRMANEPPRHYRRGNWRFCQACYTEGQRRLRLHHLRTERNTPPVFEPVTAADIGGLDMLPQRWSGMYWLRLWLARVKDEMVMSVLSEAEHEIVSAAIAAGEFGAVTVLGWQLDPPWVRA